MIKAEWIQGKITLDDLYDAHKIRRSVFIEEQGVPEEIELDDVDLKSIHLIVYEEGKPIATGRIVHEKGQYRISRIAVKKEYRGQKIGDFVVRLLIRKINNLGSDEVHVHAQAQVKEFYKKLGFRVKGEPFEEAGISHVYMVRMGDIQGHCC